MLIPLPNGINIHRMTTEQQLTTRTSTRPVAYSYVRFSTPSQGSDHSDSLRRQTSEATQYCKTHNLILSEDHFHDLGKSGYFGHNLSDDGQLKRFLDLCESGRINKGSYLICENLDRLTRSNIFTALETIRRILDSFTSATARNALAILSIRLEESVSGTPNLLKI